MRPVAPRLVGVDERMAGDDSPELMPMTVGECRSQEGAPVIITRWRLTEAEKQQVMLDGLDIFLYVFAPLMPQIQISIGSKYHEHQSGEE